MCNRAIVTLSTNDNDNRELEKLIKPLKKRTSIKFDITTSERNFLDRSELPFIMTDEGDNYFGLESIKFFVERELKRRTPSGSK